MGRTADLSRALLHVRAGTVGVWRSGETMGSMKVKKSFDIFGGMQLKRTPEYMYIYIYIRICFLFTHNYTYYTYNVSIYKDRIM